MFSVLILPMRNGNIDQMRKYEIVDISGSYPTYEEWKQSTDGRKHLIIPPVLILPMRNGNPDRRQNEPGKIMVLILPMRNGNSKPHVGNNVRMFRSYPTYKEWKPT